MIKTSNGSASLLMSEDQLLDELCHVPLFAPILEVGDDEQAPCLTFLKQGEQIYLQPGERLVSEGDPADFYIVLEGDLHVLKKVGGQEMLLTTHHAGAFFGELPLLLGTTFFASGEAVNECRVFKLQHEAFWNMLGSCPVITKEILRTMAQRTQSIETLSQGREKLMSLGTMAAGLAHELNNPASATRRAAKELGQSVGALPAHACRFSKQHLEAAQLEYISQVQQELAARSVPAIPLDPLSRSDLEDEVSDWLEAHRVEDGWTLASVLVETGLDVAWLEKFAAHLPLGSLGAVLHWMVATLTVDGLVQDIESGTTRIADLVQAVKSYSYLDQAPQQEIDIHEGLESTLTLLGHKLKNVSVTRQYASDLPRIIAYGSELNQVWTNLIDNAADAVADQKTGRVGIRTWCESGRVIVEISDNGIGIAPKVQERIFEPFFTTKSIGKGTGLGLGISHRIVVSRHLGDINVHSQPGDTVFQVRLPLRPQVHPPHTNSGSPAHS